MTTHGIFRVVGVEVVGPYTLTVRFDDHTSRTINFEPALAGEIYAPLKNLDVFNQVRIDSEVHTLVWPNGADFDPATLHDWPLYERAFAERAQQWQTVHL